MLLPFSPLCYLSYGDFSPLCAFLFSTLCFSFFYYVFSNVFPYESRSCPLHQGETSSCHRRSIPDDLMLIPNLDLMMTLILAISRCDYKSGLVLPLARASPAADNLLSFSSFSHSLHSSLRLPFLHLWFLILVCPMFGVSYVCVPISVGSDLYMGWHLLVLCRTGVDNISHRRV